MEIMIDQYPTEQYYSRIEDISLSNMTIAMPMSKGYPVYLNRGGYFYGKVIINGAVYRFKSSLLEKRVHPLPIWIISLPIEIKKIQQRAFVRIEAMLPVKFKIFSNSQDDSPPIAVMTKDISGGGLRIVYKLSLKLGTRLQISIDIPDIGVVETLGEVMRVDKLDGERDIYGIGVKFLNMPEGLRSKVIKFVFKKQLEYRQKGL